MILSILQMVLKRIGNNVGLTLSTALGLVVTVAVVVGVLTYSDGVMERLLQAELTKEADRPPAAVLARHLENAEARTTMRQFQQLEDYMENQAPEVLGVPAKFRIRYFSTDTMPLYIGGVETERQANSTVYARPCWMEDVEKHIDIVEGRIYSDLAPAEGEDVEIIISEDAAMELHLRLGDRRLTVGPDRHNPVQVMLKVVGIYRAKDPSEDYWIYDPRAFYNRLLVSREALFSRFLEPIPEVRHEYSWYIIFDHTQIHVSSVGRVISGLSRMQSRMATLMPSTKLDISPQKTLETYERKAFFLKILLFVLSVPVVVVVLYYIVNSASLVVDRQRAEVASLKSRGASDLQVVGVYLVEGLLVVAAALVLGPLLGILVAQLIGSAYGFLLFAQRPPLPIHPSDQIVQFALGAVVLSLLASLIPAYGAARHTIVTYKQEVARSIRGGPWQRYILDLVVVGLAAYGYWTLSQKQTVVQVGQAGDVFMEPFLLLIPAIFIFAAAVVFLRVFPLVMQALSWLGGRFTGVSVSLALRQIARSPNYYTPVVLLLVLTVALGSYSASMAQTLDANYSDHVRYRVPADLIVQEVWEYDEARGSWSYPPLERHDVPGVVHYTRVRNFEAWPTTTSNPEKGVLMGVDPSDFVRVAWYRKDFSYNSLGFLMNLLAAQEDALIVSPGYLVDNGLHVGDEVTLNVQGANVDFQVRAWTSLFPTQFPQDGYFYIANLEYIYDHTGTIPYEVWFKLDKGVRTADVLDALHKNDVIPIAFQDGRAAVGAGRTDPQRTGLFGVLSVSFIVAAMLTVLGFLMYSFLSFQRRMLQMGILRAIGLSSGQLLALLVFEQVFLILVGALVGTAVGVTTGNLFIPYMQVAASAKEMIPRFQVMTAWGEMLRMYVVLGCMLAAALVGMTWLLARLRISQAVKLGEEQ